jgi:hypothetical protein
MTTSASKALASESRQRKKTVAEGMSLRMLLSLPQAKQFGLTEEKAESILKDIHKQIK